MRSKRSSATHVATAFFLLANALILVIAEKIGKRTRTLEELVERDAIWIGFAQVLAIFPGISRSGSTIFGGMARNLQRVSAAKFSLLMSIPVMLAAGGYATLKLIAIPDFWSLLPVFIPGFVTAGVVGYFSIRWLLKYLTHATLYRICDLLPAGRADRDRLFLFQLNSGGIGRK